MQNQLQKAINLVKKTGDRIIVFEHVESNNPFVVMNLDDYEKMAVGKSDVRGLTEDELLDKINRDIAIWKSEQEDSFWSWKKEIVDKRESSEKSDDFEDFPGIQEEDQMAESLEPKAKWKIPEERKEAADEIIEEDRQYLEEVRF